LEAAYSTVIEELLPEMGAEQIADREEAQQTFEKICFRAGRPGAEIERAALCRAMLAYVGPEAPPPARVWLLRQLERMSGRESVDGLSALLEDDDPQVRELARRALERNPSREAGIAIRSALDRAEDPTWRVALVNSVAARGDALGVRAIDRLCNVQDEQVAAAAIAALGEMDNPLAITSLQRLLQDSDDAGRGRAAEAVLRIADRYLEAGRFMRADIAYFEVYHSDVAWSLRRAALRGHAQAVGAAAIPILRTVIRGDEDGRMQDAAVRFLQEIEGPEASRALIDLFDELAARSVEVQESIARGEPNSEQRRSAEIQVHVQALLIEALAQRADADARDVVIGAVESPEQKVRLAALHALERLGGEDEVVLLAEVAANRDGEEREAARKSLYRLTGATIDRVILQGIESHSEAGVRAELIRSLVQRGSSLRWRGVLTGVVDSEPNVRAAAFSAAGELASLKELSQLVGWLIKEEDEQAREAAEDAVVAVILRLAEPADGTSSVIAALEQASAKDRASLIRVLGRIRDENSLAAIRQALCEEDERVADAAVRALANWESTEALDDLWRIAEGSSNQTHRVLALRACVRLIRLPSDREPPDTFALLDKAMQLAEQADDRKLVLSAWGDVVHPEALRLVEPYLADPELREEAALALINIAKGLSAGKPESARVALEQVRDSQISEHVTGQVEQAFEYLDRHRGYLVEWQISGPYSDEDLEARDLLDTPFAPEQDGKGELDWRRLRPTDSREPWVFDLEKAVGGSNRCVYLRSRLWSQVRQPALLEIGSDDGVKAWLNDDSVHANNTFRGQELAQDNVAVELQRGWNTLMLKITQGSGAWGFSCGVKAPDGGNLEDVRLNEGLGEVDE
jgi:HEAT repeat protein